MDPPKLNEFGVPKAWCGGPFYWFLAIAMALGLGGLTGGSILLAYADFSRFWMHPFIAFALLVGGPFLTDLRFQMKLRVAIAGAIAYLITPVTLFACFWIMSLPVFEPIFNNKGMGPIGLLLGSGATWLGLIYCVLGRTQRPKKGDEP